MVHRGVVLWASGPVVCTCTHLPEHRIEIRLSVEGVEVDVAVFEDIDARGADLIDGSIGEASMFHSTFGYYAHGVAATTAILPVQWRERLVRFETPATGGVVAWCLDPHDLWISKAIAGRDKDLGFCRALLELGVVDGEELSRRLAHVGSIDDRVRTVVQGRIDGR